MSIVRWDPFRELEEMSGRLNRIFGQGIGPRGAEQSRDAMANFDWAPSVDIAETPQEFVVKAELPAVKKEDVKVSVDAGVLRIQGHRQQEAEEQNQKFHRVERQYGSFMRSFTLPDNIDDAKVSADFKDGVLNVHLPKSEKTKAKTVEVKIS
jgi:HSP20 family protein